MNSYATFHDHEFIFEFMYMKNIVKSYLKSCVPRFQMMTAQSKLHWDGQKKEAAASSFCPFAPRTAAPVEKHRGALLRGHRSGSHVTTGRPGSNLGPAF